MSGSNCCFLTSIQVTQETGEVVWYSHLFKNFPQLVVIHTVKGFSVVNETEIDYFLNHLAFSVSSRYWICCGSSAFSKPRFYNWNSWFTYCWSLAWWILSITLLVCEMSAIVWELEHSLALPFFGFGMKTDLSQSCDHCWVFQICWHIECSTFTALSFRIWNSSTGIP